MKLIPKILSVVLIVAFALVISLVPCFAYSFPSPYSVRTSTDSTVPIIHVPTSVEVTVGTQHVFSTLPVAPALYEYNNGLEYFYNIPGFLSEHYYEDNFVTFDFLGEYISFDLAYALDLYDSGSAFYLPTLSQMSELVGSPANSLAYSFPEAWLYSLDSYSPPVYNADGGSHGRDMFWVHVPGVYNSLPGWYAAYLSADFDVLSNGSIDYSNLSGFVVFGSSPDDDDQIVLDEFDTSISTLNFATIQDYLSSVSPYFNNPCIFNHDFYVTGGNLLSCTVNFDSSPELCSFGHLIPAYVKQEVDVNPFQWIFDAINGVLSINLFGSISVGSLIVVVIAIPALIAMLRGIAGG